MAFASIPSSKDIYIEVNGKRLAAAQSYQAKTTRESHYVQAFGQAQPVGTVGGRVEHQIQLSRIRVCSGALDDGVDFYNLSDFNIVIVKPDCKIIYSGCVWTGIAEGLSLNELCIETMTAVASKRMEVA